MFVQSYLFNQNPRTNRGWNLKLKGTPDLVSSLFFFLIPKYLLVRVLELLSDVHVK